MISRSRRLIQPAVVAFALAANAAFSPSGLAAAATETPSLSRTDEANLFRLGKVWGYLKYHHDAVRQGCFDWDTELLEQLPRHIGLSGEAESREAMNQWVRGLDERDCKRAPEPSEDIQFSVDSGWREGGSLLGSELAGMLDAIGDASGYSPQYYVSKETGAGNPAFLHEAAYAELDLDWRHRILALFRYWNIIEYWFPYRNQITSDWDAVLREFVPRLIVAGDDDAYALELMALIARVEDGHANLWNAFDRRPPAGDKNVAAHIRWVEGQPLVWRVIDPAEPSEKDRDLDRLAFGDVILAVDDVPVDTLIERWRPYHGASNEVSLLREICRSLLRGNVDTVEVTIDRDGARRDLRLPRRKGPFDSVFSHDRDGETFQSLGDGVAYLKLSTVDANAASGYIDSAAGYRGLVIDIRNYPSDFVVFALGRHLVAEPTQFARFTNIDLQNPGTIRWAGEPLELEPEAPHFEGRVVILVDEISMSQSEYTTMAFRAAAGAVVVGSRTAGADGNISFVPLPGGHRTSISGIGVFYPDKTPTQKVGIVPDIEVLPTVAGIRSGRDEVLEAAIREILGDDADPDRIREMSAIPHARQ